MVEERQAYVQRRIGTCLMDLRTYYKAKRNQQISCYVGTEMECQLEESRDHFWLACMLQAQRKLSEKYWLNQFIK